MATSSRKGPIVKALSNADFGRRVGIHYTHASRLRNGQRLPSVSVLSSVQDAFQLNDKETSEMLEAARDPEAFGRWIDEHLFDEHA